MNGDASTDRRPSLRSGLIHGTVQFENHWRTEKRRNKSQEAHQPGDSEDLKTQQKIPSAMSLAELRIGEKSLDRHMENATAKVNSETTVIRQPLHLKIRHEVDGLPD